MRKILGRKNRVKENPKANRLEGFPFSIIKTIYKWIIHSCFKILVYFPYLCIEGHDCMQFLIIAS